MSSPHAWFSSAWRIAVVLGAATLLGLLTDCVRRESVLRPKPAEFHPR